MAITVTPNLTTVADGSTTTGWTADGGWSNFGSQSIVFLEGSSALEGQTSQGAGHIYFTLGTAINMTLTQNRRAYGWIAPPGSFDTFANGGLRFVVGDGTNRIAYYVGGSDRSGFQRGAWFCLTIDANNPPSTFATLAGSEANLNWAAVTELGYGVNNASKAVGNSPNTFADVLRYGTGLTVTSGTTDNISFIDISDDDILTANQYGIIRELATDVFGIQGDIILGDGTGTGSIDFDASDEVIVIEDNVQGTGTNTPININGVHNATGSFNVTFGVAVGTGDVQQGRNGCTFINANSSQSVNFNFSDTDIESFSLYGCSLTNITGTVSFSADATNGVNHRISGTSFTGCSQILAGIVPIRNSLFINTSDIDAALLWNESIDIKNCNFIANTTGAGIEMPSAVGSPYVYDNLIFSGNTFDVLNSSGSTIEISKSNGSNPTTSEGSAVTFLGASVTTLIEVRDLTIGSVISGARVLVYVTDATNFPYEASVSITGSGTTATVTHTSHGLTSGDYVIIRGANEDVYNGVYSITVTGTNTYTYTTNETINTSPATGTTTSTFAFISGTTDINGQISDTRVVNNNQPITGWVRKSSSSPYYVQGVITGTVDNQNGFSTTIQLARDE